MDEVIEKIRRTADEVMDPASREPCAPSSSTAWTSFMPWQASLRIHQPTHPALPHLRSMRLDEQALAQLREYFAGQPVKQAHLFGSFARGPADERSDVDILVELDHTKSIGLHFIQMGLDLEALLSRPVGLATTKGSSLHVKPYVDRDKQLIYARG